MATIDRFVKAREVKSSPSSLIQTGIISPAECDVEVATFLVKFETSKAMACGLPGLSVECRERVVIHVAPHVYSQTVVMDGVKCRGSTIRGQLLLMPTL